MNYYVYVYLDPRKPGNYQYQEYIFNYEPFYVGKGRQGRAYYHLKGNFVNAFFSNVFEKIKEENLVPTVLLFKQNLTEEQAYNLEIDLIKVIGKRKDNSGP